MRAALWTAVILGSVAGTAWANPPQVQSQNLRCEVNPKGAGWEKRGAVQVAMQGNDLVLTFFADEFNTSSLDSLSTTNTPNELMVQARCLGEVVLGNDKPFKIRDFRFNVGFAEIGSEKGGITFKAKGQARVISNNQTDTFEKDWKMTKSQLESGETFAVQKESQTVCGNQLAIRFDDLRGTVRGELDFNPTFVSVQSFVVALDPC